MTVAGELRFQRIQESIATNPNFSFVSPRYFTAYAESTFPVNFFVDGRRDDGQLDMEAALSFFQNSSFPTDFYRPPNPRGPRGIDTVASAHPMKPGANAGQINSYTLDPSSADFTKFCLLYTNFVNETVRSLYPNPEGDLRDALKMNLKFFYSGLGDSGCNQIFPYGH